MLGKRTCQVPLHVVFGKEDAMDCFVRCLREGSADASSTSVFLIEDNLASVRSSAVTEAACPAA